MFDQLKDLYKLKKQAEELQKQLAQEKITGASRDGMVSVTINGNHDLLEVKFNSDNSDKQKLAQAIIEAHRSACDQLKSILQTRFAGMM